ncbi:hypothetical protein SDC9_192743 [bioreactor metagenome]|uniref:Uncharacterized protein n=1 Tax=bioreactor metagenome TaxID=1076179 RepID=A0A645I2T3_9ZZZZ
MLGGEETIEGYISGKGRLIVIKADGEKLQFEVEEGSEGFSQLIEIGDIMQWQAQENLVVFEICFPPYQDGRFENLDDSAIS